jgi:hypothetical protein
MTSALAWKRRDVGCLDCLICEPADVYHAQSRHYLSSHGLAEFRRCPLLFQQKRLGLIPSEDRLAYLVGRAAHTLILEGREQFQAEYVVGGPVNPKTGSPFGQGTKAWAEWAAAQGKPVLTDDQFALISQLAASVHAHPIAAVLLRQGVAERVARADYRGVPSQVRVDWFDREAGIVDLKTCDDLTWFEADAKRFGYVHQVAFYRAVLAEVAGKVFPVHFIAVEKKPPFRCGVWQVHANALAIAQQENEAAVDRLRQCRDLDSWPTGYEETRVFDHV